MLLRAVCPTLKAAPSAALRCALRLEVACLTPPTKRAAKPRTVLGGASAATVASVLNTSGVTGAVLLHGTSAGAANDACKSGDEQRTVSLPSTGARSIKAEVAPEVVANGVAAVFAAHWLGAIDA